MSDIKVLKFGTSSMGKIGSNVIGFLPPFEPTSIPNCVLWLNNTSASMTLSGSNKVSEWRDLSGLNHHFTQGTGANQPLFVSSGINGQNGVYFSNSADNFMDCIFSTTYAQPFTTILVWNLDANSTQSFPILFDRSTTTTNRVTTMWRSNQIRLFAPNPADVQAKTRPFSLVSNAIEWNGSSTLFYENNTLISTSNPSTASLIDMRLGNQAGTNSSAYRLSGYICEHIVFSRQLTSDEKLTLNNYLTTKYGL